MRTIEFQLKNRFSYFVTKANQRGRCGRRCVYFINICSFFFTKPFQNVQKLLLSNFQHIFYEVKLILQSFILVFSKKWYNLHFCFKFHEPMSVSCKMTQHTSCSRSIDFTVMWVRWALLEVLQLFFSKKWKQQ